MVILVQLSMHHLTLRDDQTASSILPKDIHGRSQTSYTACVMASSAMGFKLGVFKFLPTTHTKTNTIQMRPWSLRSVRRFTWVYLHAQTAVDAGDIRTWRTTVILIMGKTQDPQFEPHAGIKMAQVLGSPMYIYDLTNKSITLLLCPQQQIADSWILFNSGVTVLYDVPIATVPQGS